MSVAVVCFQWNTGFREYLPEHVNILARGFRRNLTFPHRFVCVTDESDGFSDDVEVLPLPSAARKLAALSSPHGPRYPSSYRRLWAFSNEAADLGDFILMTDIDCIVTGCLDPLVQYAIDNDASFVGWRPPTTWNGVKRVAGGTWLLRSGAHTEVWESFSVGGARDARAAGQLGSDQAWISYCLAGSCAVWPKGHGIYEAQWMRPNKFRVLPETARIVHFNGDEKPWHMLHIDWVRERWQ